METRPDGAEDASGRRIGRRAVLGTFGLGVAGIVFGSKVTSFLDDVLAPIIDNDPTGLTGYIPGSGRFRIYTVVSHRPMRTNEEYRLKVDGLVDEPLSLSWRQLRTELPQTALTRDFQCVTGWRVDDVKWRGVRLRDVLDRAGVRPGATHLRLHSFDGAYTESLTMEQARRDDVLVAHEMLGKPVTQEHGGPVRLYVAPMYGYKSLKWLDRIEVVDELVEGYWEERGYDVDAWVGRSNGRGDEPT
jgi:DMSO/TMAO reductase YedYZ molybdopterin-dependent catalytic subunit